MGHQHDVGGLSPGPSRPNIGDHIHIVVGIVIVLSLIPIGVEWWRARARPHDAVSGRR